MHTNLGDLDFQKKFNRMVHKGLRKGSKEKGTILYLILWKF